MATALALAFIAAGYQAPLTEMSDEEAQLHPNVVLALQHPAVKTALASGMFYWSNCRGSVYFGNFLAYMEEDRAAWPGISSYDVPIRYFHRELSDFEGRDISEEMIRTAESFVKKAAEVRPLTIRQVVDNGFRQKLDEACRRSKGSYRNYVELLDVQQLDESMLDSYEEVQAIMIAWTKAREALNVSYHGWPLYDLEVEPFEGETIQEAATRMIKEICG